MKKEYDFSKAKVAKFYTPVEKMEIPVYLDKDVQSFYHQVACKKKIDLGKLINSILKKEMAIQKVLAS